MAEKVTKQSVNYGPAKATSLEQCRVCAHFQRPNACELVQGHINPGDWCELFEKRNG